MPKKFFWASVPFGGCRGGRRGDRACFL